MSKQLFNLKKVIIFLLCTVLFFSFDVFLPNKSSAREDTIPVDELDQALIKEKVRQKKFKEWKQEKNDPEKELTDESEFIHNDGKPIETNILEDTNDNFLFAIYRTKIKGVTYEKYYFSNKNTEDLSDIKQDILKNDKKIKVDEDAFINELEKGEQSSTQSSNEVSAAYVSQPPGGYWKIYSWTFYSTIGAKIGVYTTNNNFKRVSSSADINGTTGSVWNIHTFQSYEPYSVIGMLEQQITRLDVNYSAQKLLSYGPFDDAGFSVSVQLNGITSPLSWVFETGLVSTNNVSSIANKYGRWIWSRNLGFPDPFITEPGIRVSNTSGSLAVKMSHSFNLYYDPHSTGTITVLIPDR